MAEYLKCFSAVILWSEYPNHLYKPDMIEGSLREVLASNQNAFPPTPFTERMGADAEHLLHAFEASIKKTAVKK